jgi:hypothetical protein
MFFHAYRIIEYKINKIIALKNQFKIENTEFRIKKLNVEIVNRFNISRRKVHFQQQKIITFQQ